MVRRSPFLLVLTLVSGVAQGQGVSGYLPLDMPPQVERQIDLVMALADRPVVRRPLAVAAVQDALPRACERDAVLCGQVQRYLSRHAARLSVTDAQLEVAASDGPSVPLANRRGMESGDEWMAAATARWQPAQHVAVAVGGVARSGDFDPAGSYVSLGTSYLQLDVGYRERWSSPLTDSSFLMSTNAPSMPSVTVSNPLPLSQAGISYELYVARMSWSEHIAYQGRSTSGHPQLAGVSLAIEPVPGWSLGFSRQMQFGGGERSGSTAGDLLKAFFNPSGYDNTRVGSSTDGEFGNQRAAWTSRFIYPGSRPVVISLEYAGEDTSHSTSGRLGNAALSMGIHVPRLWRNVDLAYEISEWQNGWGSHHIYADGMVNDGRALGHWGMDRLAPGYDFGAQTHMLRLGWTTRSGSSVDLKFRTQKNTGASTAYQRWTEFGAHYAAPVGRALVGGELTMGRDVHGDGYVRVAASARLRDAGEVGLVGGDWERPASGGNGSFFADVGMAVSRMRVDRDSTQPATSTAARTAPHLALGLRRAVTNRSDLGVRIEFDQIEDHAMLAVRAVDYRYRVGRHLAFTAFAGAARYDAETPAYGYYLGTGVQWREILPRWDLGLDLRYGDKLARDKLLPHESGYTRSDTFYDVYSMSLSMSYRL